MRVPQRHSQSPALAEISPKLVSDLQKPNYKSPNQQKGASFDLCGYPPKKNLTKTQQEKREAR